MLWRAWGPLKPHRNQHFFWLQTSEVWVIFGIVKTPSMRWPVFVLGLFDPDCNWMRRRGSRRVWNILKKNVGNRGLICVSPKRLLSYTEYTLACTVPWQNSPDPLLPWSALPLPLPLPLHPLEHPLFWASPPESSPKVGMAGSGCLEAQFPW